MHNNRAAAKGLYGVAEDIAGVRLDGYLRLYITDVVSFERQPLAQGVLRQIAGALSIVFGGRTGLAEIFDEFLAFGQLLLFKPKNGTGAFQRKRQAHVCRPDHRVFQDYGSR